MMIKLRLFITARLSQAGPVAILLAIASFMMTTGDLQRFGSVTIASLLIPLSLLISAPKLWAQRQTIWRDRLLWIFMGFVLLALVSLVRSDDPDRLAIALRIPGYVAIYLVTTTMIRHEHQIRMIIVVILIGAAIQVPIVAIENITTENIGRYVRPTGSFQNPNSVGYVLMLGLIITVLLRSLYPVKQIIIWIIAGAIFGALILTLSKSALLGVTAAALAYLLVTPGFSPKRKTTISIALVIGAAALVTAVFIYNRNYASPDGLYSLTSRIESVLPAFRAWSKSPLFGVGFSQFKFDTHGVHNVLLNTLVEMGLVAFMLYSGIVGTIFINTIKAVRQRSLESSRGLFLIIVALLASQHAFNLTHQSLITAQFWMISAIAVAAYRNLPQQTSPQNLTD